MAAHVSSVHEKDALSWYATHFPSASLKGGPDTLRCLFSLMIGLGMMESSGEYLTGRDRNSRKTPTSLSAEAGLFQQSWDSHGASPLLAKLLKRGGVDCLLEGFQESASEKEIERVIIGSGDGAKLQLPCKKCPMFAVEAARIRLRDLRTHWGALHRRNFETE